MTAQEYYDQVAELGAIAPGHPLLRTLQGGHSRMNEIYLRHAQKSLDPSAMAEGSTENDPDLEELDDPGDPEMRRMRGEIKGLFFERNKMSNRFRNCHSQRDRAEVSEEIALLQRNIGRLMARMRHWRISGQLAPGDDGGHYMPKDGFAIAALQNSLRSSISRKRAEIAELQGLDLTEDERGQRKLETCMKKLESLEAHLALVKRKIAET